MEKFGGRGQGCRVSRLPPRRASRGPRFYLESAGVGIVGSLRVTPLLLQFRLTQLSFREGRGGRAGGQGRRRKERGGLPSFFREAG